MNYYPHHIGDFNNATRHLTRVERSLYRDLIELYYDTEHPLPADDFDRLARRVIASTEEEKAALRFVLTEFFYLDGTVYRNERCDKEIQQYRENIEKKSKAGKASAASRQQNPTPVEHPLNECATNQEPITNNQEKEKPNSKDLPPLSRRPPPESRGARLPDDFEIPQSWHSWARSVRPEINSQTEGDKFLDYWHAKSGKDAAKRDWFATWRNWIRNAKATAEHENDRRSRAQRHSDKLDEIARASIERERAERTLDGGDFQDIAGPLRSQVG